MTKPTTIGQLLDLAWEQFYAASKAPATHRVERNHLIEALGYDTPLEMIDTDVIVLMTVQWRANGSSAGTVNRKLAMLRRAMSWAARRRWIDHVPYIETAREPRGRKRWVTDEELAAVVDMVPDDVGDLFMVLAHTGMRLGEALSLGWEQVDFEGSSIFLPDTKSGYPRTVPLNETAKAALERRASERPTVPFENLYNQRVSYHWRRARRAMGLEHDKEFVVHALRHRVASMLVQDGVTLQVVAELLGHRKLQTTMRYAHLATSQLVDAVSRLG